MPSDSLQVIQLDSERFLSGGGRKMRILSEEKLNQISDGAFNHYRRKFYMMTAAPFCETCRETHPCDRRVDSPEVVAVTTFMANSIRRRNALK